MFKIYFPKKLLDKNNRSEIFPLLKPFIKSSNYSDNQRLKDYGVSQSDFLLLDNIDNSELVILPMSWNYYVKNN